MDALKKLAGAEAGERASVDIKARYQRAGLLWKLPMSKPGGEKWQKRNVVAKDGWLLYYAPTEDVRCVRVGVRVRRGPGCARGARAPRRARPRRPAPTAGGGGPPARRWHPQLATRGRWGAQTRS